MPPGNPHLQVSIPSRVTASQQEGAGSLASKGKSDKTAIASAWLSCTVEQAVGELRSLQLRFVASSASNPATIPALTH